MEALKKMRLLLLCFLSFSLICCDELLKNEEEGDEILIEKVVLDQTEVELKEGTTLVLIATITPSNATVQELEWTSDNEDIATVDANGKVTACSEGRSTITVTTTDGSEKSASCEVTVVARRPGEVLVEEIILSASAVSLKVGETSKLTFTVTPENATDPSVSWISTDNAVARVSDGEITAEGEGQAIVKAIANDGSGVTASCVVTVVRVNNEDNDDKAMSPIEAKNKMESAGITFANAIKAETHQNLVDVLLYLDEDLAYYEIDEDYLEKLESLAEESGYEDYARGINPVRAMIGMTGLCVNSAQKGAQLSTRVADIYTLTLKAGLKDLYGKFVPDHENEVWKYTSVNDRLEISFTDDNNQKWVATLKGSKATTSVKITARDKQEFNDEYTGGPYDEEFSNSSGWDDNYDITIDVPEQITFVVTCNAKNIVDLCVNSSLALEATFNHEHEHEDYYVYYDHYDYYGWYDLNDSQCEHTYTFDISYSNLNLDAKMVVNGYEETFKTDITKSGITASVGVKIDGRSMATASANIKANIDALIEDACEEEFKARNIENFSMKFDVLGEVQLDADCPNFKNLYDAAMYFEDADDIDGANQWLDEVNKSYTAKLRFDNTSVTQATFELEAMEENDGWDSYVYTYPVMVFASNGSRYSLDDYFTESAFADLIDAMERLAEQFEDLYGDYFEEEDSEYGDH